MAESRRCGRWALCLANLLILGLGVVVGHRLPRLSPQAPVETRTSFQSGITLEQIEPLGELVMLHVDVSDVIVTDLHGYTGGVTAALLVKGDLFLGTDLSRAHFDLIEVQHHTALLILTPPRVVTSRIDHDHSRIVALWRHGLWDCVPGERPEEAAIERGYAEAQHAVANAGASASADQGARTQVAVSTELLFSVVGMGCETSVE